MKMKRKLGNLVGGDEGKPVSSFNLFFSLTLMGINNNNRLPVCRTNTG